MRSTPVGRPGGRYYHGNCTGSAVDGSHGLVAYALSVHAFCGFCGFRGLQHRYLYQRTMRYPVLNGATRSELRAPMSRWRRRYPI